jgi:hypothetical protein
VAEGGLQIRTYVFPDYKSGKAEKQIVGFIIRRFFPDGT